MQVDVQGLRVQRVREFGLVYLALALWTSAGFFRISGHQVRSAMSQRPSLVGILKNGPIRGAVEATLKDLMAILYSYEGTGPTRLLGLAMWWASTSTTTSTRENGGDSNSGT